MKTLVLVAAMATASSAFAAPIYYFTRLSGAAENPVNASTATGFAEVTIDTATHTLAVGSQFFGLTGGNATAAHIHCCVAPPGNVGTAVLAPSLTGFPLGVTAGGYSRVFDLTQASSWTAAFITNNGGTTAGAEAALAAGLAAGNAYFNIHNATFGGGEIRGFFVAAPEPSTFALMGAALVGLLLKRRR